MIFKQARYSLNSKDNITNKIILTLKKRAKILKKGNIHYKYFVIRYVKFHIHKCKYVITIFNYIIIQLLWFNSHITFYFDRN